MERKEEIRRRKMNYWARKASRCRHERYQPSCFSCSLHEGCEIQRMYNKYLNNG